MSNKPEIVFPQGWQGEHNADLGKTTQRLSKSKSYQDQRAICLTPTPNGYLHTKVVHSMRSIMVPMNQGLLPLYLNNMEVGEAYSNAIEMIINSSELSKIPYILTWEHDNLAPPDGLLKLLENMDTFDIIGGLYFTKGEGGMPMCYGRVDEYPVNFKPFMPIGENVVPCRGVAMGFTLFKTSIFKDPALPRPFFKTLQEYDPVKGGSAYTQDLYFSENAGRLGYKMGIDPRVKVGHMMMDGSDFVW